jgi:hypothetical protein
MLQNHMEIQLLFPESLMLIMPETKSQEDPILVLSYFVIELQLCGIQNVKKMWRLQLLDQNT